jgi:ribonuclease P protein component
LPHSRIGLSVSRRFGSAVRRNKIRRLYREAFRLSKVELPVGLDLVIVPRSNEIPTLDNLMRSFRTLAPKVANRLAKEAKST